MKIVKNILSVMLSVTCMTACVVNDDSGLSAANSTASVSSGTSANTDNSENSTVPISTEISSSSGANYTSEQAIYIDVSGKYSADGSTWESIKTAASSSEAESVLDTGDKVYFTIYNGSSTGLIRIDLSDVKKKTAVYLSGTMTSGGVNIQTAKKYETGLYLNGVSITSSNFPCIAMTKKGAVSVFLSDGTENILTDGRKFATGYGEEYSETSGSTYTDEDGETANCTLSNSVENNGSDSKGTLYAKGDMTISGNGSLKITQSYKNCIASKSILTIESGDYTLISGGKSGLYGDCGVYVKGGAIDFNGTGLVSSSANHKAHGINTDDETYSNSFVNISGGILNFETNYGKGITSPVVIISGGTNTISVKSPASKLLDTSASYYDADGVSTSETVSFSPQGIDGNSITISGGTTIITAPWSGVNSDGNIEISGGSLTITTSANGVYDSSEGDYTAPSCLKADGNIVITGGTITGTNSGNGGKGIKADGTYTQSAGSVNVKVSGSNLGSSSSSNGIMWPGSSSSSSSASASAKGVKITGSISVSGGKLYASSSNHEAIESKSTITISGGEVYGYSVSDDGINASSHFTISGGYVCAYAPNNDGLDTNGNLYIEGGLVYAIGSSTPEKSLDANTEGGYKVYISGGTVIALGPIEDGSSLSQACYSSSSWSENTIYGLTVGERTYTFKTPASTSGYGSGLIVSASSTPSLTSGAIAGGTSYFDALVSDGGTAGSTPILLSAYNSSSSKRM